MKLIISNISGIPIYEQIKQQIKSAIMSGELNEYEALPSLRTLAKELKISVLTVTRAYTELEQEGFVTTVHGKGSFVSSANQAQLLEEKKREVEEELDHAIRKGRSCGMTSKEIMDLFQIILEEE